MNNELNQSEEFDWSCIKDGVPKGQRHAALSTYMNRLISQGYHGYQLMRAIATWNKLNSPPLRPEEILSAIYHSDIDNSVLDDEWLTEPNFHGAWTIIVCKGTQYQSKVSHCGDWKCLYCGDLMRRDWINHLVNATKGQDLYMVQANVKALPAKLNAICEVKAEYVHIRTGRDWERLTMILSKHIDNATKIPGNTLREVLESIIPEQCEYYGLLAPWHAYISVFASPAWKMTSDPADPTARLLLRTTLPVFLQQEIAMSLGGEPCGYSKWQSPSDVNQAEWQNRFVIRVRQYEEDRNTISKELWEHKKRDSLKVKVPLYGLDDYYEFLYGYYDEV